MKKAKSKGAGLLLVVIIFSVLAILSAALLGMSVANAKNIAYQNKSKQAYYIARSGADAVGTYIINNPTEDTSLISQMSDDNTTFFENGTFNVSIKSNGANQISITGTGMVGGVTKTTTQVLRRMTLGELIDKAIYTDAPLDIGNMKVEGDIQSAGTIDYRTKGNNKYDDTKYKALPNTPKYIDTLLPSAMPPMYPGSDLTVTSDLSINSSYRFNSIEIGQNKTLEIVADNKEINIVVDNLVAKGNIKITASGSGKVNLFVNNLMEVQTKGYINNKHPKNLYIYMQENSTFRMRANITTNAYIIAPDAYVEIQSEKSTVNGAIIAKELTKNGNNGPNGGVVFVPPENSSMIDTNIKAYTVLKWE